MDEDQDEDRRRRYTRAAAAGAGAAVGAIIGGPGGAIAGAALGAFIEPFAEKVFAELSSDGRRRASEVLAFASEAAELQIEDLSELIATTERTRLQAGIALSAATRTAWPHKIRTLGPVLASGLLATDEAMIDTDEFILAAVADIEAPHLSLLELLVCYEPGYPAGPAAEVFKPITGITGWQIGRRSWTAEQIIIARPRLQPILTSLIGTMLRHGLAVQNDNVPKALEKYTNAMSLAISSGGSPTITPPSPSWSPTPLGEQVLGKYREIGDESDEQR